MKMIDQYREKHRHPLNRLTHTFGIPLIVASLGVAFFNWHYALALFLIGWAFQFAGHLIEGSWPAFFSQPLHLLVGPYWWLRRILGLS